MTTRLLRAFGTLAVALVILAGCDSAAESSGLSTGDIAATTAKSAMSQTYYVSGPSPTYVGSCYTYTAYAIGTTTPVAVTWSVSGGGFLSGSTATTVTVQATATPSFTLTSNRSGEILTGVVPVKPGGEENC